MLRTDSAWRQESTMKTSLRVLIPGFVDCFKSLLYRHCLAYRRALALKRICAYPAR
jgi:hypothetical protein